MTNLQRMELRTDRLTLRKLSERDIPDLFALDQDPEVRLGLTYVMATTLAANAGSRRVMEKSGEVCGSGRMKLPA
jgi:RimJ/RimL family protein N-acetyltransferase